jgi:hypothetical protein
MHSYVDKKIILVKSGCYNISFRLEDYPETEVSVRNLLFVVKLPIRQHKVAKTLVDNEASLNLIMRKTFIMMGLNLLDLTPAHDTFHGAISRQSSTPIGHIDLEVSCGTGDNKHKEMLKFEVASFDIGYNCILWRPFLLKFMVVIHTAYASMKIPDPKGVITIRADQWDALTCENTSLSQVGRFGKETTQKQSAKLAKTQGGSTPLKTSTPRPPIVSTPQPPSAKKGTYVASSSNQQLADQPTDDKKKGADDKEVLVDPK